MMELTPGYYRHFKDAVAPMKRGNPSGKGKVPSGRKPLSRFIGRRSGVRPASMWTEIVDKQVEGREYHGRSQTARFAAVDEKDVPEEIKQIHKI